MRKMLNKIKNAKGAVTIEATISLTAFLFLFIMIYSLITICRTQAIIQVAINASAKQLSQYSYLYSITGLHDAMSNVSKGAEETKKNVNDVAANVSQVFSGIQSIGNTNVEFGSVDEMMGTWEDITSELKNMGESASNAKETIEKMISQEPHQLFFGMAKLMASEGYELVKSLVAGAVCHALVQDHLKRSDKIDAEAFCRNVGIRPGTYLGIESFYNGIDFSHSKLLPYGSSEILVVANYKMRVLPLLPIDIELHFTQTASTMAWMQGDADIPDSPQEVVLQRGDDIWNASDGQGREKLIRNMGIAELKDQGFYSVSGNDYIHGYKADPQEFSVIRSYNPLEGYNSVGAVNTAEIVARLEKISSEVSSATDNIHSIKIKKPDADGNLKTNEVNCDGESKKKVILVIPEDPGLKEIFDEALKSVNTDVEFEFLPGYGSVFKDEKNENAGG